MAVYKDIYESTDESNQVESAGVQDSPDRLVRWILTELKKAMPQVERWRSQAQEAYRFIDGHQVSDADAAALKSAGRPDNAFNSAQKFIRFVTGAERIAPEAVIYNPIDENDARQQIYGEFLTRCYDWAIAKGSGTFERSRAFYDLIVGGMGWEDYYVDTSRDPRGLPAMTRLDPMEMIFPDSSRQNIVDSRWRARKTKIDIDEAISRWPEHEDDIEANVIGKSAMNTRWPTTDEPVKYKIREIEAEPLADHKLDMDGTEQVEILEWQWYDEEMGYYFVDPIELEDVWLEERQFRSYRGRLLLSGGPKIEDYTRQTRRVHKKIFILNDKIRLGEVIRIPGNRFTFNAMTSHYDQEDRLWYGYARILIDPQRYANKFFNQMIEIMAHQAKGGMLYEEGAIKAKMVDDFKENYSKPGTSQEVAQEAISQNRIREKALPQIPAASIAILEFCIKSMNTVTGLSPEMAFDGNVADTAGVTMRQKQQSSLVLLAQEFDSLSRFRIEESKIIFDMLSLLADDRLIRVGGAFDGQVLQLMHQPFSLEYEISLDDTERDPNMRRVYTENIMQLAPILIRQNKFLPEILDYVQLPVKFREKLKKAIMQSAQADMQAAQQGIQRGGRSAPASPEERQVKVAKVAADTKVQEAKALRIGSQQKRDEYRTIIEPLLKIEQMRLERERQQIQARQMAQQSKATEKKGVLDFASTLLTQAMSDEARKQAASISNAAKQQAKQPLVGARS